MASRTGTADILLDRLREQFPELSADDLAVAAVGVAPLTDLRRHEPDAPAARRETPRHRA